MKKSRIAKILLIALLLLPMVVSAQTVPRVTIGVDQAQSPNDVAVTLQIIMFLTVLTLSPAILIMLTSFTRIVIIFSFLRSALGTQQAPPTQVMIGLAMFITFFIMAPVGKQINDTALQPFLNKQLSQKQFFERTMEPVRDFMFSQTREKDLSLFVNISGMERPASMQDVPSHVLIPAFIISEFRIAFQIGFLLFIPFLMLDMIVASVLMSMGMMMLPPVLISLPFKVLLFVLVDGWYLIVGSIVAGFQ